MSDSVKTKQEDAVKEAEPRESAPQGKRSIVIWESEATFAVVPLGEQGEPNAPLLRVHASGFGQAVAGRSKLGSGPIASLRSAA
ncbi:hypothetical protein [Cohnella thailandensis]|uniref:Uncharacterized protein n=1 Tax=Cohnella thailandensis TaxID=557557 RepID=A0A841SZE4_9BACL|nr:hypothetical protein [Cohnella thailandensis]MBB6635605.1 hypothetical protein [Cohnella thailandensis]MBP1974985.1 hypothetical protein [Cohnella thailandensis]